MYLINKLYKLWMDELLSIISFIYFFLYLTLMKMTPVNNTPIAPHTTVINIRKRIGLTM